LVCSMYKTPSRFSPHSNLISAELSRYWLQCSRHFCSINRISPMSRLIRQRFT
jgi:hypothetical protein